MARFQRKISFWLYYWPRWALEWPFLALVCPIFRFRALGTYQGIAICKATFSRSTSKRFLGHTLEALQLIERIDPRRFKRIQREIHFIVHAELLSGASYNQFGRICNVDYCKYEFDRDHDWYLYCYASTLVHEATHGTICSNYVAYSLRNRCRIERICHREEYRFLHKLDTPERSWSKQIAGEFDPRSWSPYWHSNWLSRARGLWKRASDVRKDSSKNR